MVQYAFHGPPSAEPPIMRDPSRPDVDVVPLIPWTWSKPSILDQLKPRPSNAVPDDPPAELHFAVTPTDYFTAFKPGQLIKLHFPIAHSSFI